jgi:hypothetical protein
VEEREEGNDRVPIENHLEADDSSGSGWMAISPRLKEHGIWTLFMSLQLPCIRSTPYLRPLPALFISCCCAQAMPMPMPTRQAPDISQGAGVSTLHDGISEDSAVFRIQGLIRYATAIVALGFFCIARP